MSVQVLAESRMAKQTGRRDDRPSASSERIDMRVDSELKARVERQADRLGISVSAYIRQAFIRQLEADEASARRAAE